MSILRATILDYTPQSHSGRLITDSGIEYRFSGYSWTESTPPKAGDLVQIIISNNGIVESIDYLNEYSNVPPKLPQNYNFIDPTLNNMNSGVGNDSNSSYPNLVVNSLDTLYLKESNYSFFDWILKSFKNYANFSGRARRKEYWYFYLAASLFTLICRLIIYIVTISPPSYDTASAILSGIAILNLILIIPMFAVGARRLHDVGRSGWWQLLELVPVIGWLTLLYFFCRNTSYQNNEWGPPAKPMY